MKHKENKTEDQSAAVDFEKECQEIKAKYLLLAADFENARKRWERDRLDLAKWANAQLLQEMLVVVDELEQALIMIKTHSNVESILQGLEMTHKNFLTVFKKNGVEVIEAKGKKFDPHLHEIVSSRQEPEIEEHIVLEEIQKGYILAGRILRTAKVVVGIPKNKITDQESQDIGQESEKEEEKEEGLGEA